MRTIIVCILLTVIYSLECQAQQDTAYRVSKVLIDAGHGGKDPGALGKVSKEKDLTLKIALKLGHYIDSLIPGVEVVYTRTTDVFLSLKERAEMTNKIMPDVFISVHINSCKNKKVKGFTTYVNGTAKDEAQLEIQKKENGGEEVSDDEIINMKIVQASNHSNSELLANKIQEHFSNTQWFKKQKTQNLGVKAASFAVLWRAYMPAVLVECGYISNQDEERYLASELGQTNIASSIFRGFRAYKNAAETSGNTPVQTQPATEPKSTAQNTTAPKNTTPKTEPKQSTNQQSTNQQVNKSSNQQSTNQQVNKSTNQQSANQQVNKSTNNQNIYFRVQIKSSPKKIPLNSKEFKGLKNVEEIQIDGVYKYTIGKTQNYKDIVNKQSEVRKTIPDAFVIATKGNKRMDLKDARKALGQ
ncbi:MAG: N-acetylmuramoyl-L-alanine amidase [Bacteroidales bacterium]|nr:N-acetylmuramoyl-L-alanine amidase [Bacteroidales bacterium]